MSGWPPAGHSRSGELFDVGEAGPCERPSNDEGDGDGDGVGVDPDRVTGGDSVGGGVPTVRDLSSAGLLSDRQAEAYILRELEEYSRREAADLMSIEPSTLDEHLHKARQKVQAARRTVELLEVHRKGVEADD